MPTGASEWTPAGSPGRPASCPAVGGGGWRRDGTPGDQRCRSGGVEVHRQDNVKLLGHMSSEGDEMRRLLSYLRLRPCMTASGPEDTGASWVGRQPLKSAHWIKESPLSAIKVLREKERKSPHCFHTEFPRVKFLPLLVGFSPCLQ